jgi:pilus assembly protein CpaC
MTYKPLASIAALVLAGWIAGAGTFARFAHAAEGDDAQENASGGEASEDSEFETPIEGDEPEAARAPRSPKKSGNPYRKSRLTRDEQEIRSDKRTLLLTTGEDKVVDVDFDIKGPEHLERGNPQILAVTTIRIAGGQKSQLVFKPLKAGETTVTVRDEEGNLKLLFKVRITGSNLLRVANEVRTLLRDIEGIEIRIVGPKVVIEGEVLVPSDYGRLLTIIQDASYRDFVLNTVTLSQQSLQVLAKRIQDDVNEFAPNVRTRVLNGVIILQGTVESPDTATRALKVANLYIPEQKPGSQLLRDPTVQSMPQRKPVESMIVVNPPPPRKQEKLVRVTVNFVELKKDYSKVFGFKWEPGFGPAGDQAPPQIGVGQGGSSGFSLGGTISNLFPRLQSAQNAGFARILKTGTVIVRSGQPANIVEQTEFPFTQVAANGQITAGKTPVGLSVFVTPLILGQSEDIQLDLNMDQVNLVGRVLAGQPPVTATHKVSTKLYVKSNESAAVAAVTSGSVGTDFNRDDPRPQTFDPNGDRQPLFTLMRSKAYRKDRSQFVIFVTPQIIDSASEGTQDLQKNFRVKVR